MPKYEVVNAIDAIGGCCQLVDEAFVEGWEFECETDLCAIEVVHVRQSLDRDKLTRLMGAVVRPMCRPLCGKCWEHAPVYRNNLIRIEPSGEEIEV